MEKFIRSVLIFILLFMVMTTIFSCSKKNEKVQDVDIDKTDKESIDIVFVNDSGIENGFWLGTPEDIKNANTVKPGDISYSKSSLHVEKGVLDDFISVNCGLDSTEIVSDVLSVSGNYLEAKPIVVIWNGEYFSAVYPGEDES